MGPAVQSLERFFDALAEFETEGDSIETLAPLLGFRADALHANGKGKALRFRRRDTPAWEVPATGPGRLERAHASGTRATMPVGKEHRASVYARSQRSQVEKVAYLSGVW